MKRSIARRLNHHLGQFHLKLFTSCKVIQTQASENVCLKIRNRWKMVACGIRNPGLWNTEFSLRESGIALTIAGNSETTLLPCVASVSVWFRSKERPRNGIFGILAPFFAQSLTLVPLSLLLNHTETLATQSTTPRNPESKTVLDYSVRYMGETSHTMTRVLFIRKTFTRNPRKNSTWSNMIIVYKAGRFFFSFRWQGRIGGMPPRLPRCDPVCCV